MADATSTKAPFSSYLELQAFGFGVQGVCCAVAQKQRRLGCGLASKNFVKCEEQLRPENGWPSDSFIPPHAGNTTLPYSFSGVHLNSNVDGRSDPMIFQILKLPRLRVSGSESRGHLFRISRS